MTFTSKIGKFVFSDECNLSTAKLIRDTVTASILNPPEGSQRLKRDHDQIGQFVRTNFKYDSIHLENVVLS